ncbi:MAG: hypothetical protein ACKVTZ_17270, partial [Bacteroidia bacterium]
MKRVICIIIFASFFDFIVAQKHDNYWVQGINTYPWAQQIGYYGGYALDFSASSINIIPDTSAIYMGRGNTSMSDANGNLLFYTNGITVANAQHDTMVNGKYLHGGNFANAFPDVGDPFAHEIIALVKPWSNKEYYILQPYHISASNSPVIKFLYSKIDMNLDNGLGAVVEKNIPIIDSTILDTLANYSVTAVKHGNGRDWWVVIPNNHATDVYLVLVTPNGVQPPIKSKISNDAYKFTAYNVFSPNGEVYVQYLPDNKLRIIDFDRCSGAFSNERVIYTGCATCGTVGLTISPNSRFLYNIGLMKIYQYDLQASNIQASATLVASNDGFLDTTQFGQNHPVPFYTPQLAPDGKIYLAPGATLPYMHIIHNPNAQGVACNVEQHVLLPHLNDQSMTNFPTYRLGAKVGSACDTLSVSNQDAVSNK